MGGTFAADALAARTAVVTGVARGIGQAIAIELAAVGAHVVGIDRPGESTDATAQAIRSAGGVFTPVEADLADTDRVPALADRLRAEHGPLHVLVNNAGIASIAHAVDVTPAEWRRIMAVNADAVFLLSARVGAHMIADGIAGRIVVITSKNAVAAEAGLAPYNASKAAAWMIVQSLASEFGPHGITVNAVAPGMIDTPIGESLDVDLAGLTEAWLQRIPSSIGYGSPADVASAVVYLASDAARYVNGAQLLVDGGAMADQLPRQRFMGPAAGIPPRPE
ncbi:SDR family NAD(P)-dependent oxidoreductase [Herbiconiux sp.]|uniref:SDR family NAD(P)-dependent oxidoreductase n=1 Tax=Herbiconiux sp. TaxID=1871186 RepID=UPI0025BFE2C5|nr:SDR family NAD(P)-dependent oxidoreductase [Herbiconiux sp.]